MRPEHLLLVGAVKVSHILGSNFIVAAMTNCYNLWIFCEDVRERRKGILSRFCPSKKIFPWMNDYDDNNASIIMRLRHGGWFGLV